METSEEKADIGSEKKEVLETSVEIIEEGFVFIQKGGEKILNEEPLKLAGEYWNTLGPGLVTGASDDDPSGIATYSQTGARYGFQLLWLSWFTFPLMAVIQEMCARIGVVTGHGLAANIRKNYSKRTLYIITSLLFIANTFNIGADLGAMAKGTQLVFPHLNFAILIVGFALLSLLLQIFTTYAEYAKYLKYLAFVLLAYVVSALMSGLDWHLVIHHLVAPHLTFSRDQIFLICGILGTTISPYLFFWQTSQEVEEQNLQGKENEVVWSYPVEKKQFRRVRADVWSGMFFSNIVMFFIIAACAGTLFTHGITTITTAADAAAALRPFAGNEAFWLFAIGIVGTGMLAIPVLAGSSSYAISESFGWKHGLYRKLKEAYAFYGVIIVSVIFGILLNFIGIDPIKALIFSAVANGIIAPVILIFIVKMSSNREIMGKHASGKTYRVMGWFTIGLMALSGVAAIISLF